jgi:hypothetical protein
MILTTFVSGSPIDYTARREFLCATTALLQPPPIDVLLDLLPTFRRWDAHFDDDCASQVQKAISWSQRKILDADNSVEAVALKQAVAAWMARYRFSDDWIFEAAICNLFRHSQPVPPATPRTWYIQPPWEHMNPEPPPRKGNESTEHYAKRVRREMLARERFAKGINTNQVQPAKWTVLRFLGGSYPSISEAEGVPEDTVRKAVVAFIKRAGITLPQT